MYSFGETTVFTAVAQAKGNKARGPLAGNVPPSWQGGRRRHISSAWRARGEREGGTEGRAMKSSFRRAHTQNRYRAHWKSVPHCPLSSCLPTGEGPDRPWTPALPAVSHPRPHTEDTGSLGDRQTSWTVLVKM